MECLILRFDAPLMSFGGPAVDQHGVVLPFPPRSLLTGLIANALGFDHRHTDRLDALQHRIRYAVRCDRPGDPIVDFQTVDLGQDELIDKNSAWTTWNKIDSRAGGNAQEGTHIRYRHYRADAIFTLALTLVPPGALPTLSEVADALGQPQRPLFIGRKCCLPSTPVCLQLIEAVDPLAALTRVPSVPVSRREKAAPTRLQSWWDEPTPAGGESEFTGPESGGSAPAQDILVFDLRDWLNQVHCGRTRMRHGLITVSEV